MSIYIVNCHLVYNELLKLYYKTEFGLTKIELLQLPTVSMQTLMPIGHCSLQKPHVDIPMPSLQAYCNLCSSVYFSYFYASSSWYQCVYKELINHVTAMNFGFIKVETVITDSHDSDTSAYFDFAPYRDHRSLHLCAPLHASHCVNTFFSFYLS